MQPAAGHERTSKQASSPACCAGKAAGAGSISLPTCGLWPDSDALWTAMLPEAFLQPERPIVSFVSAMQPTKQRSQEACQAFAGIDEA